MSILALRQNFRVSASPAEEVEKEAEKVAEKWWWRREGCKSVGEKWGGGEVRRVREEEGEIRCM